MASIQRFEKKEKITEESQQVSTGPKKSSGKCPKLDGNPLQTPNEANEVIDPSPSSSSFPLPHCIDSSPIVIGSRVNSNPFFLLS